MLDLFMKGWICVRGCDFVRVARLSHIFESRIGESKIESRSYAFEGGLGSKKPRLVRMSRNRSRAIVSVTLKVERSFFLGISIRVPVQRVLPNPTTLADRKSGRHHILQDNDRYIAQRCFWYERNFSGRAFPLNRRLVEVASDEKAVELFRRVGE